jgi:hypothetical protein
VTTEKSYWEHQLSPCFGDEVWQILPWSPPNPEDASSRKIQTGDYRQQHSPTQVRLWSRQWNCLWSLRTIGWLIPWNFKLVLTLIFLLTGNRRLSTTPCWPRLVFITTQATTLSWAQHAESTSESALCRLLILEIPISSGLCLPVKVVKDSNTCKVLSCMMWNTHLYLSALCVLSVWCRFLGLSFFLTSTTVRHCRGMVKCYNDNNQNFFQEWNLIKAKSVPI